MAFVSEISGLPAEKPLTTPDGTAQVKFGTQKKGSGTLQLYLTQRSLSAGNALIQIGEKEADWAKEIRAAVLKSAWFTDTPEKSARMNDKGAEKEIKNTGRVTLPLLTAISEERDYKKTIQVVRSALGVNTQKALEEYGRKSGLNSQHKFFTAIENAFKEE
jgi:hypothetical protein